MKLIELSGLTFTVNGKNILDRLDFSISDKEVHAILGTNGTGKSTLAYLIMGCEGYRQAAGDILFEGNKINDLMIHERAQLGITMAWQEPVRFEGICVADYLTIGKKKTNPALSLQLVGLQPELYLDRMVDRSLSGGERKRIELASVLALRPKLAILDEPDSGIDMLSIHDIINVINVFRENGSAVLLITHRDEIAMIADRASQLCQGKIVYSGTPKAVAEYYKSRECLQCDGEVCR